jgi:hypothetical protein
MINGDIAPLRGAFAQDVTPHVAPQVPPKSSRRRANCWYRGMTLLNLAEEA